MTKIQECDVGTCSLTVPFRTVNVVCDNVSNLIKDLFDRKLCLTYFPYWVYPSLNESNCAGEKDQRLYRYMCCLEYCSCKSISPVQLSSKALCSSNASCFGLQFVNYRRERKHQFDQNDSAQNIMRLILTAFLLQRKIFLATILYIVALIFWIFAMVAIPCDTWTRD